MQIWASKGWRVWFLSMHIRFFFGSEGKYRQICCPIPENRFRKSTVRCCQHLIQASIGQGKSGTTCSGNPIHRTEAQFDKAQFWVRDRTRWHSEFHSNMFFIKKWCQRAHLKVQRFQSMWQRHLTLTPHFDTSLCETVFWVAFGRSQM